MVVAACASCVIGCSVFVGRVFLVGCLLSGVVCCKLLCVLLVVCWLLCGVRCAVWVARCLLFVARFVLLVVCWLLCDASKLLCVVCSVLVAGWRVLAFVVC